MRYLLHISLAIVFFAVSALHAAETNYEKERYAFAAKSDFNPYSLQALEVASIEIAMKVWESRKQADAFKEFNSLLDIYPYSIEAHLRLADGCAIILESPLTPEQKTFFETLEKKHREAYNGIIKSITSKHDGKTMKTAYPVITISEEYMVLRELGFEPQQQSADLERGFDIFTVKDQKGHERKVYFNIDKIVNSPGLKSKKQ